MAIHNFVEIATIEPNSSMFSLLGINFNDSTQPAKFSIDFNANDESYSCPVSIRAPIGEVIRSVLLPEAMFLSEKEKLKGMNESSTTVNFSGNRKTLSQKIFEVANLAVVSSEDDIIRYVVSSQQ